MQASFIIRPAEPADVDAIYAMIFESAQFGGVEHLLVADAAMLGQALFGASPGCEALVGCVDGAPVMIALFFHTFSSFQCRKSLYLEDLYVRPAARGLGYGKQMLATLAQLALRRGCSRFEWGVMSWNDNAIRFYQGVGADVLPDLRICRLSGAALAALSDAA
ncbi:GNAT superfamily N-acetyltransferase [Janthinobacterium sp. CG_23.3]|uniref:GNAT family N-acetyltransferase n=1 Tax=unclassified Janthinobacterium TaxID=2610881 RepID=UPI002DFCC79F|nr:GNAT superfamily N-acetyltransferase [Janthinobacterium sp. CG_S6]